MYLAVMMRWSSWLCWKCGECLDDEILKNRRESMGRIRLVAREARTAEEMEEG